MIYWRIYLFQRSYQVFLLVTTIYFLLRPTSQKKNNNLYLSFKRNFFSKKNLLQMQGANEDPGNLAFLIHRQNLKITLVSQYEQHQKDI